MPLRYHSAHAFAWVTSDRADRLQRSRTSRRPRSIATIVEAESLPWRSLSRERSTVNNCDTLVTESREWPDAAFRTNTFPGSSASRRFDVMAATTIVRMLLRLNPSDWRMTTGRRNPGSDPTGSGTEAHQISPCNITIR